MKKYSSPRKSWKLVVLKINKYDLSKTPPTLIFRKIPVPLTGALLNSVALARLTHYLPPFNPSRFVSLRDSPQIAFFPDRTFEKVLVSNAICLRRAPNKGKSGTARTPGGRAPSASPYAEGAGYIVITACCRAESNYSGCVQTE